MTSYFQAGNAGAPSDGLGISGPGSPGHATGNRSNALASRITSVLSASYSDLDIRDALETIDARGIRNTPDTRRQLRLDVQKEIIQCNGEVVKDFGQVAEVFEAFTGILNIRG